MEKVMKQKNSRKYMVLASILVFAILISLFPTSVQALSVSKSTKKAYQKKYHSINNKMEKMGEGGACGKAYFKLNGCKNVCCCVFANRGMSGNEGRELIILSYNQGKVKCIGDFEGGNIYVYKDYIVTEWAMYGIEHVATLYQFKNGKFIERAQKDIIIENASSINYTKIFHKKISKMVRKQDLDFAKFKELTRRQ